MTNTTMQRDFLAVCALLLLFPFARFNWTGKISEAENRTLAKRAHIHKDGKINWGYFSDWDKWLNDRFGGRDQLVAIYELSDMLSPLSSNDKLVRGKNGWIFYFSATDGDLRYDYFKQNLFSESELSRAVALLQDRSDWCKAHGIKFLALIAPNKHSVYSEYYPLPRPDGITRSDQLIAALKDTDVHIVFPRDLLIASKEKYGVPLYYNTGTHWNNIGGYIASRPILEQIYKFFPDVSFPHIDVKIRFWPTKYRSVDSTSPMMGIKTYSKDYWCDVSPVCREWSYYYTYDNLYNPDKVVVTKGADSTLPKAIFYNDSFTAMSLEPNLSGMFRFAEYRRRLFTQEEKKQLLVDRPDIVVWEWVERATGILPNIDKS